MWKVGFFAALSLGVVGCKEDPKPPRAGPIPSVAQTPEIKLTQPLDRPRTPEELRTTSAKIWIGNTRGRIQAGRDLLEKNPEIVSRYGLLASSLITVGKFDGNLDQIAEARDLATKALEKDEKYTNARVVRAEAAQTLHEFEQALADAEAAYAKLKDPASRARVADIKWNLGRYDEAIPEIRKIASKRPDIYPLTRLAQLEMALGNPDAAAKGMARAETRFRDTNPLPLAWLNVQRGLIELHRGDFPKAKVFYDAAVERIDSYPMAIEHLAEIEYLLGNTDRAIELYRKVIEATNDPEFLSALGGVLAEQGKKEEAQKLFDQAKERYDELLKKHPAAMYWHAADFFLNEGDDPKKALELLEKNRDIRPTAKSYAALALAQLANGKVDEAAETIAIAEKTPVRTAEIFWASAKIKMAQKNEADAKKLVDAAKKLNPKIEVLEGPLVEGSDTEKPDEGAAKPAASGAPAPKK